MSPSSTTDQPPVAERPYTHEMVVIHRAFRRESAFLPRLVRAVPDGSTARAAKVADHLRAYLTGLHSHHSVEDELLWPLLRERAAEHDGLLAHMEEQHRRIDRGFETVTEWAAAWERVADPVAGEELALALVDHRAALLEHLDDEEDLVLPLVAEHLTAAEWDLVGRRGMEQVLRNRLLLTLGAILEDASPGERAHFLGRTPPLGRVLWRAVGRRRYAAACRTLRGPLDGE